MLLEASPHLSLSCWCENHQKAARRQTPTWAANLSLLDPPTLLEGACVWAAGLLLTSGRGGCVQTGTPPPCRAGPRTKFRNLVSVPQRHPALTCTALKPQEGPNMSPPEAGRVLG